MSTKSPFFVVNDFISPLTCEDIVERLNHKYPDYDEETNKPIPTITSSRLSDYRILPILEELIPTLEQYYEYKHKGILPFNYEWYVSQCQDIKPRCENSALVNGKWVRINDYDFTGIIFLNDYQDSTPFDDDFEVMGGKLEFINHNFSFTPTRGTLVIFPGNEYFINNTSPIMAGELNQIRFHMVCETLYKYDPNKFNGTYKEWFA